MRPEKVRVDYDKIARLYDEPSRDFQPDPRLQAYLEEGGRRDRAMLRILDMGCGTGKQLAADRRAFPRLPLFGLDRYRAMLQLARERSPAIPWVNGDNTSVPFAEGSFGYITNQFSYHHVHDKPRLFRETCRVLEPGGRLAITNIDPWSMRRWWIYVAFPEAWDLDSGDCLPVENLTASLEAAGLVNVRFTRELQHTTEKLGQVLEYALSRHRTSQLLAIEDEAYDAGIARLRERSRHEDPSAPVPSELCLLHVTADKPGGT